MGHSDPILVLDFDGCTHKGGTILAPDGTPRSEYGPSAQLMEYVPLLEEVLSPYPEMKIVLSTSWVAALGFEKAVSYLSPSLQERVIGYTFQMGEALKVSYFTWQSYCRGDQICEYMKWRGLNNYVVLDDQDLWPRQVLTDDEIEVVRRQVKPKYGLGIGEQAKLDELTVLLKVCASSAQINDSERPSRPMARRFG